MTSLAITTLAAALAAAPATRPDPWALLAERDLAAIRRAVLEDHPGPVDPENPAFRTWLDAGHRDALARARRATTFGGYVAAVRRYVAGFRDGHLGLGFSLSWEGLRWPGFVVACRGGRFVVAEPDTSDPELPPAGSVLLDCDGLAPAALLERDVFPYAGIPALEASRVSQTPALLLDRGYPDVVLPKACRVEVAGEVRTVPLRYRHADGRDLWARQQRAAFGPRPAFGARPFGANGVWVSVPSFEGSDADAAKALEALIAEAPRWTSKGVIVFDVRGNGGGSSAYGGRLVEGVWGKAFAEAKVDRAPVWEKTYVEWRASPGNLRTLEELGPELAARFGKDSEEARWAERSAAALRDARRRKAPLARPAEPAPPAVPAAAPENPFRGRVFLLTDGRCASACLDFADMLKLLPGVTHVGLPTFADSVYMEGRTLDLPSGVARLQVPMKVYRGRPRGNNEPYVPVHRFDGDIGDTAAVERWVEGLEASAPPP